MIGETFPEFFHGKKSVQGSQTANDVSKIINTFHN